MLLFLSNVDSIELCFINHGDERMSLLFRVCRHQGPVDQSEDCLDILSRASQLNSVDSDLSTPLRDVQERTKSSILFNLDAGKSIPFIRQSFEMNLEITDVMWAQAAQPRKHIQNRTEKWFVVKENFLFTHKIESFNMSPCAAVAMPISQQNQQ